MYSPIKANDLSELLDFIVDGTISAKLGKQVFDIMFETGKPASLIIETQNLKQITDKNQIETVINEIIDNNQDKVQEYKSGKTKLYGFFVGEVMKSTKGKANPEIVNSILGGKLSH
jgi:aspartyl-tRNA(Asn)/glutamyl-tRNA(Gln) amidotransferase subunit B